MTLNQMGLIDIYRIFYPKATEYLFFSSIHGTFSRIVHIRPPKSLNKFKKIDITSSIFSDHNVMKPEINYKKKTRKFTNMWRLNMLLNI